MGAGDLLLIVADLDNPAPHPFAVLAVHPEQRHPDGGCYSTVVSLHMTRADAEQAVAMAKVAGAA